MSNTRNMNQAGNFWDFVASLQNNQGASSSAENRGPTAEFNPFEAQEFWGPWAHRGRRHGPPHGHHHGPPHGPHGHRGPSEGTVPPPPHVDEPTSRSPSPHTPPETPAEPHHHPRPQSPHRGPHHHHEGPHRGRGRGRGPRGGHHNSHPRGGPSGFPFDLNALAEAFGPAFFGGNIFGGPDADGFPTTREEEPKDEQSKTVNKSPRPTQTTALSPPPSISSAPPLPTSFTLLSPAPRSPISISHTTAHATALPSLVSSLALTFQRI
jgi:HSP20 family protein